MPVAVSQLWSPTGQKGPVGPLLQLDGILHCRCPPTGSRIATTTGTDNLTATAPVSSLHNRGTEHGPSDSVSPTSLRTWPKFCRRGAWNYLWQGTLPKVFFALNHSNNCSLTKTKIFGQYFSKLGFKNVNSILGTIHSDLSCMIFSGIAGLIMSRFHIFSQN